MKNISVCFLLACWCMSVLSSCSLVKCRYSPAWNIGLGKSVVFPSPKTVKLGIQKSTNEQVKDSIVKQVVLQSLPIETERIFSNSFGGGFQMQASPGYLKVSNTEKNKDSLLESRTPRKKHENNYHPVKRKSAAYRPNLWAMGDSEFALCLFLVLLGLILAGLLVYGFILLIKYLIKIAKRKTQLPSGNSTVKGKPSLGTLYK